MSDTFAIAVVFIIGAIITAFAVMMVAIPYYFDRKDSHQH